MKNFTFSVPQEVVFGNGSLAQLPELLHRCRSDRVLLISDRMLEKLGLVKRISDLAEAAGVQLSAFLDVEANPSVQTVEKAAAAYRGFGATSIIALGGGSPMDVAKAVGILVKHGGEITQYEGAHLVPGPIVPLVAIPTTAGTGSEVTAFSVITDHARNYKLSIFSYEIVPRYALLDPSLITSLPAPVAASTGIDAFIHALEAYLSRIASPFSDAMAQKAMELIGGSIRRFVANRQDSEAACAMLSGSMFAGIAFAWARLGNVHAMSHPVSAYFNVPHGIANAILLPVILEYNAMADNGRYRDIYNFISRKKAGDDFAPSVLVDEIRALLRDFDIPGSLSAAGVTAEKIPLMAADAMKSGNILANPRQSTIQDVERLYLSAL
ncbi:iron-containing alcohol dehydrogenase [Anaerotruncus sp. AF02-27]|uniref:iron-containing alcohol dehydrogenase n=1 Tax=Anaerotruncus TaxID=244127 RepID=UPI000E4BDA79|nr:MULTISPECIES: iron-containing alcohol dehydrogenase [Anaerotruncus]RGX55189.1 iron-containing alcohol dehydrogenase [Anaerotruncus sp. AF02-27]